MSHRVRALMIGATALTVVATTTGSAVGACVEPAEAGFDFGSPETVAENLDLPWGIDFLPDGSALFAQRDTAEVFQIAPGGQPEVVATIDEARPAGEGGLLGLAVSPTYADDGYVYVYYTADNDNRVARLTLDAGQPEVVVDGIPKAGIHNGGRIEFGPDGKLYVCTGDAGDGEHSQDLDSLGGKILRVEPDGSVPADNPFDGSPVYTWGHRNVQGLAWTADGQAYASELGQNTYDEVNRITAGDNYGWPVVEGPGGGGEYTDPIVTWSTAEASPSGAAIVDDWLFVAALRGQRLWLVPYDGGDPVAVLQGDLGRLRTVEHAPDGSLWVASSNGGGGDRIVRFPAE